MEKLNNTKKAFIVGYILMFSIFSIYFFSKQIKDIAHITETIDDIKNRWSTSTGWAIVSWLNIDITSPLEFLSWWSATRIIEKSDEEKYITYKESWNFRSFFPPKQNKVNWNYATNTQLMNQYLSNNTFQFSILNTKDWYLYIRLKNKTDEFLSFGMDLIKIDTL